MIASINDDGGTEPAARSAGHPGIAPVVTLLVLSPVIGEVLSGATRLSFLFALVPEIMVWGCGAVMIREAVRRWQGGWASLMLLGMGLAIAEEFIIQQTSVAPLPWLGETPAYGRVWGVNWPYFVYMLGYETVWIVLVPIRVTELIFPARRREPWLRVRGLALSAVVFLAGSLMAWFLWTQNARPNVFHVPVYHPPLLTLLLGATAIVLLAGGAYPARRTSQIARPRALPPPWVVALAAFALGLPWYVLMVLVFAPRPDLPLWMPMAAASAWAIGACFLIGRWSKASGWQERHSWALCLGAMLVCMVGGFLGASTWSRLDIAAKAAFNVIAVLGMVLLRQRLVRNAG
jgi:hypothetical protein